MALFRRNADNTFKAKAIADLEVVTAKLDAARQALAAVEVDIRNASLSAVLSDDPEAVMAPLRERHRRAQEHVELCEAAFEIAQQAQAARVAAAADAAERARLKAIKGHTASLAKAGGEMRRGLEQVLAAWTGMQRIIDKYRALLRADELKTMFGHTAPESALASLVALEMFRQAPDVAGLPLEPKGRYGVAPLKPHGKAWSEVDGIEDQIRRRFDVDAVRAALPSPAIVETGVPVDTQPPEAFVPDAMDHEMERVRRLVAGEEPAAPVEPAAPDGGGPALDDLQRRLAVEAAAVGAVEQE